ncbi:hypothetical protein FACS1894111_05190 [Clostridia bacterium]|nr:hypothetical protein FACS1894111_05190 [Clostridia bacterium]
MSEYYEKNKACLKEYYPEAADVLEAIEAGISLTDAKSKEILPVPKEDNIFPGKAQDGTDILLLEHGGRTWCLNSRFSPKEAADTYAKRYEKEQDYKTYFVFGFGDGKHIQALRKTCNETNTILVYEPDPYLFQKVIESYDLRELFSGENIILYLRGYKTFLLAYCNELIDYTNKALIEVSILPGYDVLYTRECESFIERTLNRIKNLVKDRNVFHHFKQKLPQNLLRNMKFSVKQREILQLKEAMNSYSLAGIPAILVAAGPSLDKNIDLLKTVEQKAFIVVVDAALQTVIRHGIKPHLVVTVDAGIPDRFFQGLPLGEYVFACSMTSKSREIAEQGGKIFYYGSMLTFWDDQIYKELGHVHPIMLTGGSVSTDAFSLIRYLGFSTIIFIGQDLAYTGNKTYTSGVREEKGKEKEYVKSRVLIDVEGIDGTLLKTDVQMSWYREWFEKEIEVEKDILRVIDATEGGARIKGTLLQTLEETLARECANVSPVDFLALLEAIPPAFSKEAQVRLQEQLDGYGKMVQAYEKELEKGIALYEELLLLCRKQKLSTKEFEKKQEKMKVQTKKIEDSPLSDIISYYAKKEEYQFQANIYKEKELSLEDLFERGKVLLEGYVEGCRSCEEDVREILSPVL